VDRIGLAQDRNRWRALVNSVLNLRAPRNAGKLSSGLSSSAQLRPFAHAALFQLFSISTINSLNIHLSDVSCVDTVKCIKLICSGFRFVIECIEHRNRKLSAATCRSHSTALATLFWSRLQSVQVSLPLGPRDVSVFQPQQLSTNYLSN
jgi:hypothetical protein